MHLTEIQYEQRDILNVGYFFRQNDTALKKQLVELLKITKMYLFHSKPSYILSLTKN